MADETVKEIEIQEQNSPKLTPQKMIRKTNHGSEGKDFRKIS